MPACRRLRLVGAAALAVGLVLCVMRDGSSYGSLLWVLLIFATSFSMAMALAWKPAWLKPSLTILRIEIRQQQAK